MTKFLVFTDLHYYPSEFYSEADKRLAAIRQRAEREKVDFVIHVGDLCHGPTRFPEIVEQFDAFPMDHYHVLGNHECEQNTHEEALAAYGIPQGYYAFDRGGFRFIVLDLNHLRHEGKSVPYSMANFWHLSEGDSVFTFDDVQREWFENTVMESPYPCVVFGHKSLEHINNGMTDAERQSIDRMFERLNEGKRRVWLVITGHHHKDHLRILHNAAFLSLNSASYDWVDVPHHDLYPKEYYEKYRSIGNTLVYEDPLSAVITLKEDGYVKIDGTKSRFLFGADRTSYGAPLHDGDGRRASAEILSAELMLP